MAIDCFEVQNPISTTTPVYPLKLLKPIESLKSTKTEAGIPSSYIQSTSGHWGIVALKGTATETKESSSFGISIIAQPECENNQEICPTSQEGPLYITDSKQYSLIQNNEHIPNNVVNATEGKLTQAQGFPKSKKKKRKKSPGKSSQTTPAQETRIPIPVQDEESQLNEWHTNNFQNYSSIQQTYIQFSPPNTPPSCDDIPKRLQKLISPNQYFCHVGVGKLQPPTDQFGVPHVKDVETFQNYGKITPPWGLFKFNNSFTDSESQSVEDGILSALKDSVSFGEPHNLCIIAKSWKKGDDQGEKVDNEGILLNKQLCMEDYEYRQDNHWTASKDPLGRGSFGDVFLGKDNKSGFEFAAKQIHVDVFRSEELTCCLAVKSENIIPVYGAVREGPWITVFMKHMDGGSLGQLIKTRGYLEEDWALHYTEQVLQGLKHLHAENILHGDIKAENVLLSDNGETVYLCDFGHAVHLPASGCKTRLLTGDHIPGTETHMAPEILQGELFDTKIDVWSACCMLLHMLNGWHPWSRTHKGPLYLKIATEPPPLQEIPPNCSNLTHSLLVDGLQKDPKNRADVMDLIQKVGVALDKIGGLKSSYDTEFREPRTFPPTFKEEVPVVSNSQLETFNEKVKAEHGYNLQQIIEDACLKSHTRMEQANMPFELEIERLELDLYMENLSQLFLPEEHEKMFLSEPSVESLLSHKDSMTILDTKSSGIYSLDSQMEPWSLQSGSMFNSGITTTPSWLTGIKVHLKSFGGETLDIWESGRTKLGDLAVGISSQIPMKSFTIVNSNGTPIPWDTDIADCGIELQCSVAPDRGRWLWRVKKGKIEEGNTGEVYTGGGTDALILWTPE